MNKSKQKSNQSRRLRQLLAALLALALLFAACGGDDEGSADTTFVSDEQGAPATTIATSGGGIGDDGERATPENPTDSVDFGSGGVGRPAQTPIQSGRDIIFTAEMTVRVDDVTAATAEAVRVVESFQGYIFGQQTVVEPEATTVLVFKVPPAQFQAVLAALGDVGEIRSQTISADDVTDVIVDLESRITTAETSVERLRTLLENAEAIKTITELEAQLLQRETTLEQLRGQLRTLEDQVSLATITVRITQAKARPAIDVQPTAYLGYDDEGTSCPGDSGIRVVEGETITFCLEIFNTGDTNISGIEIRDAVVEKELTDFIVVFGDLDQPLEPGQSVVLATSVEMERTLRTQTRVTATALNDDGTPIEGKTVSNTSTITLAAEDPGGIPGFSDGLQGSWQVLVNMFKLVILAIGIAVPFFWVIAAVGLLVWWSRRRSTERATAVDAGSTVATPSPEEAPDDGDGADDEVDDGWELEDDV